MTTSSLLLTPYIANLTCLGLAGTIQCSSLQVNNRLAIPHVSVPSIEWLDWEALRKAGFEGCVLDKDNTLTHPYSSQIASQLLPSLDRCQRAFAGRLVLLSNSAGLHQFDPEGNVTPDRCAFQVLASPSILDRLAQYIPL